MASARSTDLLNVWNILIVEDSPEDTETYRRYLLTSDQYRYHIVTCRNGDDALGMVIQNHYDCILLDHALPGLSGLNVMQMLRQRGYDGAIVMLTGFGDESLAVTALKGGAQDYLAKEYITKTALNLAIANSINLILSEKEKQKAEATLLQYTKQLEETNTDLESFSYVVAHDLKEPLRKIFMLSDKLNKESAGMKVEIIESIKAINKSANKMERLIDDLLEFSRLRNPGNTVRLELVDLDQIIKEVLEDLAPRIQKTGAQITATHLPTVIASHTEMRLLFQNLIVNGIKYSREGITPVIKLSSQSTLDSHILYIKDNGIGFDSKYAQKIFLPFERLHPSSKYEGSGIGLAICEKIVKRHNGAIKAESEPNKGATFIITLPAQPE